MQHTDGFESILQAFKDKNMMRSLGDLFSAQVKQVQRSWSNGRHSVAVEVNINNIREAHSLRDKVLSGDLDMKLNSALSTAWEIGVDKAAFLAFYERSLLSLTELTQHQTKALQELRESGTDEHGVIHLSAAAGAGKTFIAVKWVLDHLRMSSGQALYIAPNKALLFHFIRWLLAFAQADRDLSSRHLSRLLVLYEPYHQVQVPVIQGIKILLEPATVDLQACQVKVLDEAHGIFCADTDALIQDRLKRYNARRTVLLSDLSQGSSTTFTFDHHFPNRHPIKLTEVVRSTQRIVAGALSFRLGESQDDRVDSLGTDGPPIKTFLFEVQEGQDKMEQYAKQTIAAINYVGYHFPRISLHNRIALLVKDTDFRESLKEKLWRHLQRNFANQYFLVSCEESLGFLPGQLSAEDFAQDSQQASQNIILDAISNARGLEHLIVISIGLDAPIQGFDHQDGTTRSLLYQGITRAQLVSIVVNEFMPDGWLAFLGCLKLKKGESFDKEAAFAETHKDAAAAMLKVKDSPQEVLRLSGAPQDQLERITTITSIH